MNNRLLRSRLRDLDDFTDRRTAEPPKGTPRILVQVYDGGAIPTTADKVFLTHLVESDADDLEGATPTFSADADQTIPVVVVNAPAQAGDYLVAHAIGGRWVAEKSTTSAGFPCGSCRIPKSNLTVSWTNYLIGDGSTTLVYSPPSTWQSACTNDAIYQLGCNDGQVELRVIYFISGVCPTGQSQYCSNLRSSPFALTETGLTCGDSFLMTLTCGAACSNLSTSGYTSFTVSS